MWLVQSARQFRLRYIVKRFCDVRYTDSLLSEMFRLIIVFHVRKVMMQWPRHVTNPGFTPSSMHAFSEQTLAAVIRVYSRILGFQRLAPA